MGIWRNWQTRWLQVPVLTSEGSNPSIPTTDSIESGVYWVKRFDKSERRLTAGQTAFICRRGGIGRHWGLKIPRWKQRARSSRVGGTNLVWVGSLAVRSGRACARYHSLWGDVEFSMSIILGSLERVQLAFVSRAQLDRLCNSVIY